MRIALCLSGHMRSFNYTYDHLKSHFLNFYPDIDIFIDTWRFIDFHRHDLVNKQHIINLYKPKLLNIEDQLNLPETPIMHQKNIEPLRGIQPVLSMLYKIKSANQLKIQYEKKYGFVYDIVIRFRPDILLYDKLIIDENKLNEITSPMFSDFGGLNDQIAIANSQNMNKYCQLYDLITFYLQDDQSNYLCMKPEFFVKYHLQYNNFTINKQYINYGLMKDLGTIIKNEGRNGDQLYQK